MKKINCILVGDGGVCKTSLLITYITNNFPQRSFLVAENKFSTNIIVEDTKINLFINNSIDESYLTQFINTMKNSNVIDLQAH